MAYTNTRDTLGDQATLDGLVAHTLEELRENGVNTLGAYACYSNTGLSFVEMPGITSTKPGSSAFQGCTGLSSAAFPSMQKFGDYMFAGCIGLASVSAPEATSGGIYTFQSCTALSSVSFPKMTTLGSSMFAACTALTSFTFSTALSTIQVGTFTGCTALANVSMASVKSIGSSAFNGCTKLSTVSFPAATSVYRSAFFSCPISKLVLPLVSTIQSNVTNMACEVDLSAKPSIPANAFANDYNLFSLILRNSAMLTLSNVNALTNTPIAGGYGKIYVPNDLVATYKAGSNWATYANQIESLDNYTDGSPTGGDTITDSWAEIFAAEANGTYSTKYSVGDTKWLPAMGGYVLMQIVAFDTDELADNSGNAKITWLCKGYQGQHRMNPSNDTTGGYASSEMRSWLLSDVLPTIDATVRAQIKTVKKTTKVTTPSASVVTSEEDLWIPSYREMFGGTSYESSGCTYTSFFTNDASRIKYSYWTSSSANAWWLRSAYGSAYFATVANNGVGSGTNASYTIGVVFGFST